MEKICKTCGGVKDLRDFARSDNASCKECNKKRKEALAFNDGVLRGCGKCYKQLPHLMFYKDSKVCKVCSKAKQTEEYKENKRKKTTQYRLANPEWKKKAMKDYMRKQSEELTDTYIKISLRNSVRYKGADLKFSDFPPELIAAKRIQLQNKRLQRTISK